MAHFPTDATQNYNEFLRKCVRFCIDQEGVKKRWHITRLAMYRDLEGVIGRLVVCPNPKVLAISGSQGLAKVAGVRQAEVTAAEYPKHHICHLAFDDSQFDVVVSDQVLEHADDRPEAAFCETFRVLKPGGLYIHTTCFVNLYHPSPGDYWRFSESGLKILSEMAGLVVLKLGSWGNLSALMLINDGMRFDPIPEHPENPVFLLATESDGLYPLTTWVVGMKPLRESD